MMKPNTPFGLALCLMVAAIGLAYAGDAANPSQAGQSSIYFYDVAPTHMHGKGKLMIDLDKHTFVFNGQDFTPSALIQLRAIHQGSTDGILFASGKATPSGNLHIAGSWEGHVAPTAVSSDYTQISAYYLEQWGLFLARIACYYSTDDGVTWHESGHTYDIVKDTEAYSGLLGDLGVPAGALVRIHVIVVGGKDRTGEEVAQYPGYDNSWLVCYRIEGKTWNPTLSCWGLGFW